MLRASSRKFFALIAFYMVAALQMPVAGQLVHTPAFRDKAWQGLDLMYNMRHAEAESIFQELRGQFPNHPAAYFCLALNLWWQIYPNNLYTKLDSDFINYLDRTNELAEAMLEKTPNDDDALFLDFAATAFKARWNAVRGNMFTGARLVLKCMPALKHSAPHKDQYLEFLFGIGLYDYYAEWFNLYKPIARPFLMWFPRGDIKKGLQELETCAASQNYVRVEAAIFLTDIYGEYEQNYESAYLHAANLVKWYPANTLFQLLLARAAYNLNKLDTAEPTLQALELQYNQDKTGRQEPLYFNGPKVTTQMMQDVALTRALIFKARGDYKMAINYLRLADGYCRLNNEPEEERRPRIAYEIGLCYDALVNRNAAIAAYNTVLELPNNDRYRAKAKECLEKPCQPTAIQKAVQRK